MGNSIVDLGAAAADYVGEALSGAYDYLTGTPEASASGGYYKKLGPGARQYYSGPGEKKGETLFEYLGFAEGGDVPLQDDGSLPGVDDLRYMSPAEVEEGSYRFLQDMERQMMDHLVAAQSPVTTELGVPMQASPDNRRYHYEEAERLRNIIDQFKERRAKAISAYPDSAEKLYMKEGQEPYVRGFPDTLVEKYREGGVVSLGAADPEYIDMSGMSMNEALGLSRDDPAYMQDSGFSGPAYAEDQTRPADLLGPFLEEYNPVDGEYKRLERYDMYQDFPEGRRGSDFGRSAPELYMQDGGEPTREEAFLQAEASKRESALQLLNSLSEDELVQQFGIEGYQRLLADAGIFDFDGFQVQPQIDARVFETGSTQDLGPFDLARTQQQGRGRLGFAANVEDFGTFGAGVSGGFAKGEVEFPDELRRMGAPDKIKYGSGKLAPQSYDAFYQFPRGGPRITGQYMPSETGEDQYGVNIGYTIPFEDGGAVPEEAGIGSFLYDVVTGKVPSDKYNAMRTSGRMDDPMAQAIYGEEPTFMERLVKEYNYPANIPMQDEQGFAIMDPETGGQKMMMATDFNLPEYMRTGRPRPDMPTYGELEDARAHALASALMAKDYGPETALKAGTIKEFSEMLPLLGSSKYKDVKMDTRNNAFGISLLKKAGINATPQQLAKTVDREVFSQLDRILGRSEERRSTPAESQPFAKHYFKSPEGGLDVYFPRDKEGYFDTSYIYD